MRPAALLASRAMRWPVALGAAAAGLRLRGALFQRRLEPVTALLDRGAGGASWRRSGGPGGASGCRSGATVFFCLLAAFVVWQGVSIAWSIQPSRSWDYTNRGLVYFAFAAVGALVGGVPLRRLRGGCVRVARRVVRVGAGGEGDSGALSGLRAAGSVALSARLTGTSWRCSRRRPCRSGCGRSGRGTTGGRGSSGALLLVRGARRRGADVLARRDRADGRRCARVALARSAIGSRCSGRSRWRGSSAPWLPAVALLLPGVSSDGQLHHARLRDGLVFGAVLRRRRDRRRLCVALRADARRRSARRARGGSSRSSSCCSRALAAAVVRAGGPGDFVSARWHEFSNKSQRAGAGYAGPDRSARSSSNRWRWWTEALERVHGQAAAGDRRGDVRAHRPRSSATRSSRRPSRTRCRCSSSARPGSSASCCTSAVDCRGGDRGCCGASGRRAWLALVTGSGALRRAFVGRTSTGTSSRCWGRSFSPLGALVSGPVERSPITGRRWLVSGCRGRLCGSQRFTPLASPWLAANRVYSRRSTP